LDPTTLQQKRVCMHPYIKEQLAQRAAWSQPKPRKAHDGSHLLVHSLALFGGCATFRPSGEQQNTSTMAHIAAHADAHFHYPCE
jgi:hypothetical protein